jgi:hypothetical protein
VRRLGPIAVLLAVLVSSASAHAQAGEGYLPETWELDSPDYFILGPAVLLTDDTTAEQDPLADLLAGLSLARRWSQFELAAHFLAGTNWATGVEHVRLYAALTPRIALDVGPFEVTWGAGIAFEVRFTDDYWLLQLTASELGVVLADDGTWRLQVLGSLRSILYGGVLGFIVADAHGVPPGASRAALDALRSSPLGWTLGVVFGRQL